MAQRTQKPETALVRACLAFLELRGAFVWRNQSRVMRMQYTRKDGRVDDRLMRFGIPGASDIIGVLRGGRLIAVECKVGKNKPSQMQADFLQRVRERGGVAVVAYTVDDVQDAIDADEAKKGGA
jgi:hypothetical protein